MVITELLKGKGYEISTLKSPEQILLAERDVKLAYFPETEEFTTEEVEDLLCALVFSLLLRRGIVATRFGAVEKKSQYSDKAQYDATTRQIRNMCCHRLEKYVADNDSSFNDIIRIYDEIFLM